ncbi:MAG: universal stress protein [Myxococcales bacterium]|nr:universal stress protein [Myxococcales bacterium]MDH3843047.1 universal stress protein [Myxococcales bacterium]
MKLKQIIVATDFSTESNAPICHGIEIARASGASLLAVHVVETPGDGEALESAVEHWHADSKARLTRQIESCAAKDFDVAQEIVDAPSAMEGLQSLVDSHHADLVIMGSTGLTGIKHALLGSTAQKTLRTVQAHVLVARGETPPATGYKRILVPTDFSVPAEKAMELALALASPDAQIDLVHCWRVPEATRADEHSKLVIDAVAASVKERGRKLLESFRRDAPNATFSSVNESPERGIAQKLKEGNYDLVVVGSYGRSKLRHWLLGSVAEYTAKVAPCTVAVARPDA